MAGITITIDDQQIKAKLQQLQSVVGDLQPAFREIGEQLKTNATERFVQQVDPDGNPWVDTSPATKARKTKNIEKILVESTKLMRLLRYQLNADSLEFGTNRVYGAMMQFGGTKAQYPHLWGDIPARPFLGISSKDRADILDILSHHIQAALS
jgi:phage virion morphogenesis protein